MHTFRPAVVSPRLACCLERSEECPALPRQPEDHPARSLSAPDSQPWSQKQRQPLPACLAPLGAAACHLTPFRWPSFRRYCTEDSPSFPRPSLLESHISLMHGIRNPDLSQTSKVRPSGGHSPQVSVEPLPTRAACSVRAGAGGALGRPQGAHWFLWPRHNSLDNFPQGGSLSSLCDPHLGLHTSKGQGQRPPRQPIGLFF